MSPYELAVKLEEWSKGGKLAQHERKWLDDAVAQLRFLAKQAQISNGGFTFHRGDPVMKQSGDYSFVGRVVVGYTKLNGHDKRYIVEDDRGLNLIMNGGQLKPAKMEILNNAKGT